MVATVHAIFLVLTLGQYILLSLGPLVKNPCRAGRRATCTCDISRFYRSRGFTGTENDLTQAIHSSGMDFFLVPNNPQKSVLVSPNGVAHYRISTSKQKNGPSLSIIQRPADSPEDSIVAEIEWRTWEMPTVVRCPLFRGIGRCIGKRGLGMAAQSFLYKRGHFSKSRYFIGNDGVEYRWKAIRGVGFMLTSSDTDEEVARYTSAFNEEGLFAGEKKSVLRIQPCSVDIDLVILSFMIMEKKRRDHAGDGTRLVDHDEDPQGDAGAEGGE